MNNDFEVKMGFADSDEKVEPLFSDGDGTFTHPDIDEFLNDLDLQSAIEYRSLTTTAIQLIEQGVWGVSNHETGEEIDSAPILKSLKMGLELLEVRIKELFEGYEEESTLQ